MPGYNAPSAALMQKYAVNLPGQIEALWEPLFDYQTYPAAGQAVFTFFQNPIGQSGRTLADTNLVSAGQVPKGQTFVATHIEFDLLLDNIDINTSGDPDDFLRNYYQVMVARSSVVMTIGSKPYIRQGPLKCFPPHQRIMAEAAVSTTLNATTEGTTFAQGAGAIWSLVPLTITSNQNFDVSLTFASAVAVTTECRLGCRLGGYLFRNAQ